MGMIAKFLEKKLCKKYNQVLNYKNFRIVTPLAKGPNKGKYAAWTDIKGGKRFNKNKIYNVILN